MNRKILILTLILTILFTLVACAAEKPADNNAAMPTTTTAQSATATPESVPAAEATATPAQETAADTTSPIGWSEESHSNDVDPNYEVVFPQDKVNRITITISPENWAAMQADMTDLFGEPGARSGGGPGAMPGGGDFAPLAEGGMPDGGGDFAIANPMWVTATIAFEGKTWTNVGVRYKGNSSLQNSWNNQSAALPFKLDFDEFEDAYPEIKNQRFYGFKQLSLANNFGDASYMRDTIAYGVLKDAGLAAAETATYEVFLDHGDGPVALGLYTMVEVIDDTVISHYFDDDSGNIYEAEGAGVSLAEGALDQLSTGFQKESNEDENDWSDLEGLYNILHSANRITSPEAWRAELESVFDVDTFLEWLAISAVIQHWDTYGAMAHNFYLYNNPDTGQLTWISWDHNMTLGNSMGGGGDGGMPPRSEEGQAPEAPAAPQGSAPAGGPGGRGGPGGGHSTTLDKAEVNENWPLIRYLLDDPVYYAKYLDYLQKTIDGPFNAEQIAQKYRQRAELLAPYAEKYGATATFTAAIEALIEQTNSRAAAVTGFLATAVP